MRDVALRLSLADGFQAHPLVPGPHAQTVMPLLWRPPRRLPPSAIHPVTLSDGDSVLVHENRPPSATGTESMATAILVHGLSGSAESPYMVRVATKLVQRGIRVLRMDMRGCGAGRDLARGVFHADRSGDLLEVLRWWQSQQPASRIALVGFSLGANLVLKLLANHSQVPLAVGCVAVSPPIDLDRCCRALSHGWGRFYDRYFAKSLWREFQQRRAHVDVARRVKTRVCPRTLLDFDTYITAPLGGYVSVTDYYDRASAGRDLSNVTLPTAVLAAQDDPIVPATIFSDCQFGDRVRLSLVDGGGHLGFVSTYLHKADGLGGDCRWMDWWVVRWVEELLGNANEPPHHACAG